MKKIEKQFKRTVKVYNESMLENVYMIAEKCNCTAIMKDFGMGVLITGSHAQMTSFINTFNNK